MDPSPPVRPILKTATKTGSRTRFLAASKYKSYSQSFHYTNYSSSSSRSSRRSSSSSVNSSSPGTTASSSGSTFSGMSIMNSLSSSAEPPTASATSTASSRERKRSDEIFLTPGDRRVTFSPFTKIPRKPKSRKALAESRKMTSGFVFSTGGEVEKRKQARKKQELQLMERLYLASRKRSLSWKDMLLEHCTVLKDVCDWTKHWIDVANASPVVALLRKTLRKQRHRRSRRAMRLRRQSLSPVWSDFDQADHEYMKRLALQSQSQQEQANDSGNNSIVVFQGRPSHEQQQHLQVDMPQPDLTPMKQGSFSNLLRKEGIPVDEDEQREKIAMVDDLRGVGHASIRLKVSSFSQRKQ